MAIATIHEARFVLFDDDTRLAFITSFDGPWDAYMEDFFTSGPTLALFNAIFQHVEGYEGLPDLDAVKAFIFGAQQTCGRLRTELRRYGQRDSQSAAGERCVPAGARQSRCRGGAAAPCVEAAAGRGCRLASGNRETPMSDHISGPRALADPIADITDVYAFPSPERRDKLVLVLNTLPFAKPSDAFSDGLVYRFRLRPLTATAPSEPAPFRVGGPELVFDCVFSAPVRAEGGPRAEQEGTCTAPTGETVSLRVNDEQGSSANGVRVFAGPRWDPFIMDAPGGVEDHRDGQAGVHRSRFDLPRWQECPQPRRGGRLAPFSTARSWSASSPRR